MTRPFVPPNARWNSPFPTEGRRLPGPPPAGFAAQGCPLAISSMYTVFAESEVISHIGAGERREDIAAGVVDSVVNKVSGLCQRHGVKGQLFLTGGLCDSAYLVRRLSEKLGSPVGTHPMGRYAGALGAALIARGRKAAN